MSKKIQYKAKTPTRLIIGDPWYLEAIDNKEDTGCEKQLCFIKKRLPKDMDVEVIIEEKEEKYKGMTFTSICIDIIAVTNKWDEIKKKVITDAIKNSKYHPQLLSKKGELACDTACFIIETNETYYEFKTGADGYYGNYMTYKNNELCHINLALDDDMFSFDEVVTIVKYLFKEQK